MAISLLPFGLVSLSASSYDLLFRVVRAVNTASPVTQIKSISAAHAALTSALAILLLRQSQWRAPEELQDPVFRDPSTQTSSLDDSSNPIIQMRSPFGNAITALETGYLLYDMRAMISTYSRRPESSPLALAMRSSPVMMAHHILLGSALLYLQVYIAQARERGIWIIVALLLMNVSNPLLHARWLLRRNGKDSRLMDLSFVVAFAASRFGIVAWVLQRYGAHHRLGPVQAFQRLRTSCRIGTATLMGMNGIWLALLIKGMTMRRLYGKKAMRNQ
jgi:TLC domain